jgi:glycosyltransferase involved in cell wall biosynthesis
MRDRPKILFVTSHWPLAPAYGAQQRVLNIGKLLSRFGEVSFVIVPTDPEDEGTVRRTKREFEVCGIIRPTQVALKGSFGRLPDRLRHEFDATYMATDPYEVSEPDRKALLGLVRQNDLVWVHTIRTANWFRIYRWPHSVLDVDDLPSRAYLSAARSGASPVRRLLDLRMAVVWRRREGLFPERFDVLAVCSEDDRQYLGKTEHIYVIPNGSHPQAARHRPSSELPRIGLIGNCTFAPNEEGLKWFIRNVWPAIKREFPRAQLRLVGRGSEGYLKELGPDIIGLGWLEDPGDEIASWSAMIVPIKFGSGTRVKVADGFARGCPVVSTTIGALGYDVNDGEEILLADRAEDFASACTLLLRNPELRVAISEKARKRFLERWTWDSFESTVGAIVQDCLARSNRTQRDREGAALGLDVPATGGGEPQ